MKKIILALAILTPIPALAQTAPSWKSYMATGNTADIVPSTGTSNSVSAWLAKKVDITNGASTSETLTTPAIKNATSFSLLGDSSLTVNPYGLGTRTVKSSLYSDTTATAATSSIWPNVIQTTSSTGYGNTDPVWGGEADRINLFVGMRCLSGSSSCWAENPVVYAGSGFEANAHGVEVDVENYSSDRDPSVTGYKPINGIEVTGGSSYQSSYGFDIVGNTSTISHLFHDGIGVLAGSASDNSFIDVGDATESLHIIGSHAIGLDTSGSTISGSAILLNTSQSLNFVDTTASKTYNGLSYNPYGVVVGANAPEIMLGNGGGNDYAFLGATDNSASNATLFASGAQDNINIVLQPKGTGTVQASNFVASNSLQLPVTSSAPTGTCTTGLMKVANNNLYVCLNSAWVEK